MTDRLKGCWVAFKADIREDDAEPILNAIRMINGVVGVEGKVSNFDTWNAEERVRSQWRDQILEIVWPSKK